VKRLGGATYQPVQPLVLQIEEARARLERLLGRIHDWSALDSLLPFEWSGGERRRTALASTLLACLEMARDGKVQLQQAEPFAEIYVRDRSPASEQTAQTEVAT
jgi:segregation and condensation protein A